MEFRVKNIPKFLLVLILNSPNTKTLENFSGQPTGNGLDENNEDSLHSPCIDNSVRDIFDFIPVFTNSDLCTSNAG